MKNLTKLTILFLLCSFSEITAQAIDTTQSILLMKRQSKSFIATIETDAGFKKGLLYAADSSGITILDSLFQKQFYAVSSIKSLKIKRVNAFEYGFVAPFLVFNALPVVILITIIASGSGQLGWGILGLTEIGVVTLSLLFGVIAAATSYVNLQHLALENYYELLRRIKRTPQEYLLKHHPNAPHLKVIYPTKQ